MPPEGGIRRCFYYTPAKYTFQAPTGCNEMYTCREQTRRAQKFRSSLFKGLQVQGSALVAPAGAKGPRTLGQRRGFGRCLPLAVPFTGRRPQKGYSKGVVGAGPVLGLLCFLWKHQPAAGVRSSRYLPKTARRRSWRAHFGPTGLKPHPSPSRPAQRHSRQTIRRLFNLSFCSIICKKPANKHRPNLRHPPNSSS